MDTVMEFLEHIVNIFAIIACIISLLYYIFLILNISIFLIREHLIDPISDFLKKRKIPNEPIQSPMPLPCERCQELEAECNRLKERLKTIQAEHDRETFNLCQTINELKTCLENYDGETIKAEFDNIISSFIKSQPIAPNVSIEHLTNLCRIPKANDRFFRALLQEFEIQSLTVTAEDGKHNISMKIKSGENTYTTTLTDCTCGDDYNQTHPKVCKHMYFLVLTIGLISSEHYGKFLKNALNSLPKEKIKSLKKK